jgi:hypothetical protein
VALLLLSLFPSSLVHAQQPSAQTQTDNTKVENADFFRLEKVPVEGGAELITIKARLDGIEAKDHENWVPLVSVLRDTLGDASPDNDQLRYVWPLTYTRPTLRQRITGAIPFFYTRVGNRGSVSEKTPPPILDLANTDCDVWNKLFWVALQGLLLDPYGTPIKASTRSYQQNIGDYRKSHVIRALSVLALYQAVEGQPAFSDAELSEIQARLKLTDKTFGGLVSENKLARYDEQQVTLARDIRGHNWELLRQRSEAESLFFEPLQMPDGGMTHAIVWVSKEDLQANQGRKYDGRFLNVANPWADKRLLNWQGYQEVRYLDSENHFVTSDVPDARRIELIPLALYGLDHPKIPILLVDFRDSLNPKKREMSRRALHDVTRNVLSLSQFGDLPYFVGRTVWDFVTGRRGMDINQPSRLRTYSQLKLLLSLNQSLNPELRDEIGRRVETVSLNPMENDLHAEAKLASQQYELLLAYAKRPDGLPQKLDRDRRAEMVALEHSKTSQTLFRLANILTFGKYVHREKPDPQMEARLDVARRMNYHTHFLQQIVKSSPQIDVTWNLDDVRVSLQYIADHAPDASSGSASVVAKVFLRTQDIDTRRSCLNTLSRIDSPKARNELIRLSQRKDLDQAGRDLLISFLNQPHVDPLSVATQKTTSVRVDQ